MREVGIIKWFGGFNPKINKLNDFGYILRDNEPDLYVNRNHLHCKPKLLTPGTAVSFELGINYKNNMEQAFKVKLLKNEDDKIIIKKCAFSNRKEYYMLAITKLFDIGDYSDIELIFPKIISLPKEEKREIINYMPTYLKLKKGIFNFLDIEEQTNILLQMEESDLIKKWNDLLFNTKIFLIYRFVIVREYIGVFNKIYETNLFVQALILIANAKEHYQEKGIMYKRASEYIYKYSSEISYKDKDYEILKDIFPVGKDNFKVDINKVWNNWTVLEFIQYCNCTDILQDINSGNKSVIMLITAINSFMKRLNL